MKKLIIGALFLSSMSVFAVDVSCKTSHGNEPEQIRVTKNDETGYSVKFDNEETVGFSCIDKSDSEFFDGHVRCTTLNGDLINIESGDGTFPNGTLMLDGSKKIGLICFDV